jgi:hypothetical protein
VDRDALRLGLENERLRDENAHLRELLGLMQGQQEHTHTDTAPDISKMTKMTQQGEVMVGDCRPGHVRMGRTLGTREEARSVALRSESMLRCRLAQLDRQVLRQQQELLVCSIPHLAMHLQAAASHTASLTRTYPL